MSKPDLAITYGNVERIVTIAPRMIRLVLGGPGLDEFTSNGSTDEYINVQFVPEGAPYQVPFDVAEARALGAGGRPIPRRFTVRAWDEQARRLTIDVVVHSDSGPASSWIHRAKVGDPLQFLGPNGSYRPDLDADWHLLVGDESALPAIARSLEAMPADTRVTAVLLVDDADHQIELDSPADADVRWLHRMVHPNNPDLLVQTVAGLDLPDGVPHGFVHGEAGETRAVRKHLLLERGLPKERFSISPYWRRNFTDESWREIKKDWMAEMARDA
ncbi:MAG: siderophore-interacting protein [Aquihabitans sp.]